MATGFRTLLPLGLSSPPVVVNVGFRGLLPLGLSSPTVDVNVGVRSMLAFWMGGAASPAGIVVPPVITPDVIVAAYSPYRPRHEYRQYAKLHALEWFDEYGRLVAHPGVWHATLRAYVENDVFGDAEANAIYRARLAALVEADVTGALKGGRGLPSRALLALFMNELA